MHQGHTPAEIDAMPVEDIERYLLALPTVLELTGVIAPDA